MKVVYDDVTLLLIGVLFNWEYLEEVNGTIR